MKEIWKNIKGYEDLYQVSDTGRVKSLSRLRKGNGGYTSERILKPTLNSKTGYLYVALCKDGKPKTKSIHRFQAIAHIKNSKNKPEVNHKDGNKLNNNSYNLEWVTSSENRNHAFAIGIQESRGSKHYKSTLNEKQVRIIKHLKNIPNGLKQYHVARLFCVNRFVIYNIWNNKTWKHIKI